MPIQADLISGQLEWKQKSLDQRCKIIRKVAALLRERTSEYAAIITQEMHKPISQALAEVTKCATVCDYYAYHAESILRPRVIDGVSPKKEVRIEPLGAILGIMPWNFPFWQALRCAVPITLAGNSFVLKHAPNTLACADAIEKLFLEAGFPVGSFQHVRMSIPEVHDWIASPMIAGVTFTGSTMVGSKIAESAGRHLKKVVLELGGSDPFIVCADADIELAAEEAVKARFQNCGQSCIAAKRFFVHASVCETFLKEFSSKASQIVVGDPTKKETYLSCMARVGLRQNLQKIVRDSVALGANVYWQHQDVFDHDNFYAPTILANVSKEMPVYSQEVFGPVASVLSFSDYEQVVEQANDTDFGLGASVWTKNADLAERIMAGVDSGSVTHNSVLHSHPAVPFGGIKKSGIGRELGDWGVWEFANHKVYHF